MKGKRAAVLGLASAVAIAFGFLESLIPFGFKVGLANSVCLFFVKRKDYSGVILVNAVRIVVCTVCFSNPVSLIYSVSGAALSFMAMWLSEKLKIFSVFGISIMGGVFHNIGQIIAAAVLFGSLAVLAYLPVLIIVGAVCGLLTATVTVLVEKKVKF